MPREIKMPKLSDTMEEGTINVWRKSEGERIEKGDVLVEIETDKADMEFEAYMSGTLARILVRAGETVAVGVPIAVVRLERDSDEDLAKFLAERGAVAEAAPAPAPRRTRRGETPDAERKAEATRQLLEIVHSLERDYDDVWGSMVKQTIRRVHPGFNEEYYGYPSFSALLEAAREDGHLELEYDPDRGNYKVRLRRKPASR
ncbi:MAG: hypothetical protein JSU66_17315 [Deltaproteobacteria bacterium]|nr:MAG: hypothetical protein JSU66_17315 [Deltaproteobacteria bacterium]